jgi:hypothetical protein
MNMSDIPRNVTPEVKVTKPFVTMHLGGQDKALIARAIEGLKKNPPPGFTIEGVRTEPYNGVSLILQVKD